MFLVIIALKYYSRSSLVRGWHLIIWFGLKLKIVILIFLILLIEKRWVLLLLQKLHLLHSNSSLLLILLLILNMVSRTVLLLLHWHLRMLRLFDIPSWSNRIRIRLFISCHNSLLSMVMSLCWSIERASGRFHHCLMSRTTNLLVSFIVIDGLIVCSIIIIRLCVQILINILVVHLVFLIYSITNWGNLFENGKSANNIFVNQIELIQKWILRAN